MADKQLEFIAGIGIALTGNAADKSVTVAADQTALGTIYEEKANKSVANGYAPLGANLLVPNANLPEATNAVKGIARFATDAEATAGALENVFVNPKQLLANSGGGDIDEIMNELSMSLWTASVSGVTDYLFGVIYSEDKGLFVAVGGYNTTSTILTSPDGITWASRVPGVTVVLSDVTYSEDKGLFVAVSRGSGTAIITSPDGITWTSGASGSTVSNLYGVTYSENEGLFVAVGGYNGTSKILTSPDGITWTSRVSGSTVSNLFGVVYSEDKGLFVAVGGSSSSNALTATSPDGITWTSRPAGVVGVLYGVTYSENEGLFVAVGYTGAITHSIPYKPSA